jgi:hypothetical protein
MKNEAELHICRNPGYSPYQKPCFACIAQLSQNSASKAQSHKKPADRI